MRSPYNLELQHDCTTCHLRSDGRFCDLPEAPLAALNAVKFTAPYPAGATLFVEGETPRGVFLLCSGRVKISTSSSEGRTLILKIAEPGEMLGVSAAMLDQPYEVTAETVEPSQVNFVRKPDFLQLLETHQSVCLRTAKQLSANCQEAQREVRSMGLSHTTSEKLARLILGWIDDGERTARGVRVKMLFTHQEIAQMLGTTRETVTRLFGELRRKHIIDVSGSNIYVTGEQELREMTSF